MRHTYTLYTEAEGTTTKIMHIKDNDTKENMWQMFSGETKKG